MSSLLGRFRGGEKHNNSSVVVGRSGNESPSSGQADSKDGEVPVFDQRDGVHSKPFPYLPLILA